MVTGDNQQTAEAIARLVGIKEVQAQVQPGGKAEAVKRCQSQEPTAMVGDGINDAPALDQSNRGIAMETAGITLLRQDLRGVGVVSRFSQATRNTIHRNLFRAFGYNIVMIPLARCQQNEPDACPLFRREGIIS